MTNKLLKQALHIPLDKNRSSDKGWVALTSVST